MSEPAAVLPVGSVVSHTHTPRDRFIRLREHLGTCIVGQELLIDRLLVALLADGHLLVEGAPGLAKTKAIRALAGAIEGTTTASSSPPTCSPRT
jgi:MoxR-like ATPase